MKYKEVRKLSKEEIAYIAGIIDGEGTITLSRHNAYKQRHVALTISNNELDLLLHIQRVIGVGTITRKNVSSPKHAQGYTYHVLGRQALRIIELTQPFLRTYKKKRAALLLKMYLTLTPRNGKYSQKLLQKRDIFIKRFFSIIPKDNNRLSAVVVVTGGGGGVEPASRK